MLKTFVSPILMVLSLILFFFNWNRGRQGRVSFLFQPPTFKVSKDKTFKTFFLTFYQRNKRIMDFRDYNFSIIVPLTA